MTRFSYKRQTLMGLHLPINELAPAFLHGEPFIKRWGRISRLHCSSKISQIVWLVPKIEGGGEEHDIIFSPVVWLHKLMSHRVSWSQYHSRFVPMQPSEELFTQCKSVLHSGSKKSCIASRQFDTKGGMKAEKRTADNETIIPVTNAPWLNSHLHL